MRSVHTTWLSLPFAFGVIVVWPGCIPPERPIAETASPGTTDPETKLPVATDDPADNGPLEEEAASQRKVPRSEPPQDEPAEVEPAEDKPSQPIALQQQHEQDPRDATAEWNGLFEKTDQHLQQDALDEARQSLARLKEIDLELTPEQTDRLAATVSELGRRLEVRQLRSTIQRLASTNSDEVRLAQNELFEQSDAAIPLLREAARDKNPVLVSGALDMLRRIGPPEEMLPIMVEVLARAEQEPSWPDAIREIELTGSPGAGEPLLKLALSSDNPNQRTAALRALGRIVDPPRHCVVALLPMIFDDGPSLAAALVAAHHALATHHQHDLFSGRGLGSDLSIEQLEQLGGLPVRLSQIMAAGDENSPSDAADAARMLAIATRQIPAEPLTGVSVRAFGAEMETAPAAAVLDGVWNTVDPKLMWRHEASKPGSIVFDLGSERTVAGVRIWNLNEPGGTHRGYKDVAVYVGSTPAELAAPAATGIVSEAPGKADAPDFSTTVPVDFVRGRYVRLEAKSVWRSDAHSGLTEVQILGF